MSDKLLLKEEVREISKALAKLSEKVSPEVLVKDKKFIQAYQYLCTKKKELAGYDLRTFVELSWEVVTGKKFKPQWYIDVICEHLELMYECEFLKLIISISPRSGKSTILSQMYPVWLWLQDPGIKVLSAAYGRTLCGRDATASRNLINSEWFQSTWGNRFKWAYDQNTKLYYRNNLGGERFATSPESTATGMSGDFLLMDDINKAKDAYSPAKLRTAVEFYEGTLISRYVDAMKYRQVCLQQRLSVDDLSGTLQRDHGDWVVLTLPEEYTGVKLIGFNRLDPRTYVGQLLKPELLPMEKVKELKETNEFTWESQYQQNPVPPGGAYVKEEDLMYWSHDGSLMRPALGDFDLLFASWDLSDGTIEAHSCDTCGIVIGKIGRQLFVLDCVLSKLTFPEQAKAVMEFNRRYNLGFSLIEKHSNGTAIIDYLQKDHPKDCGNLIPILTKEYGGDKLTRFFITLPDFASRRIYLPKKGVHLYSEEMRSQLLTFPKSSKNDFVDALVHAINYINKNPDITGANHNVSYQIDPNGSGEESVNPYRVYGNVGSIYEDNVCSDVVELFSGTR